MDISYFCHKIRKMRKITHYILYILITCTALLNIQCSGNGKKKTPLPELVHAESVMFDHPDSALYILEDMPMPSARRDKENHALWCLLVTQAQYKQVMKIPSDSLVRIAYDYYKPTNNARRKAMSALYMGDINYELRNIEDAMQYYLEGKTEVEKTDDYKTGYLVMVSLCRLYLYRDFADYALEACRKAYDYAVKDSNKRYQLASLKFMARCYCISDSLPKAIDTYHKCSDLSLELKLENYYYDIQREIALVYKNKGDIKKSLDIIKSFPIKYQPALLMGKNYYLLGQQDSAYIYLNEALKTYNIYTKASAYEYLYKLGDSPKYRKYLKTYCDSLLFYNDSIMALDKGKEIIAYKEKFDNERLTTEKQRLELEKANIMNWWMFTIVMVLLILVFFAYIYLRKQIAIRRKQKEMDNLSILLHQKDIEMKKNESYIAELQKRYEESIQKEDLYMEQSEVLLQLKKENEQLCLERDILNEKLSSYSSSSSYMQSNVKVLADRLSELEKRENELCTLILSEMPILHNLHKKPEYLSDTRLTEICRITDNIYQNFTKRLMKDVPSLSEHEIILCCLIKLRFSISEISIFMNIASTSVSRSKLRIKNKIYALSKDSSYEKSLDIWLWEY